VSKRSCLALAALVLTLAAAPVLASFSGTDVFLPSTGRGEGVGSSQWYTTIWIYNPQASPVNVQLHFLLRDQVNPSPAGTYSVMIAAGETRRFVNAVENLFGLQGFGAIRVLSNDDVVVNSRIYSVPVGDTEADSTGQFFAAVPASFAIGAGQSTEILGVYQTDPMSNSDYRYNFGVVETTGGSATIRVTARNDYGVTVASRDYSLGAYEPIQKNVSNLGGTIDGENLRLTVEVLSGDGKVVAFGSSLANSIDDPSTFEMQFRSELLASSGSTGGVSAVIAGSGLTGGGAADTVTLNVGAGQGINVGLDAVSIADSGVTTPKIAAEAVTQWKLAPSSVIATKIAAEAVTQWKIAPGSVTKSKLATSGGTAGQVLTTDGANLLWQTPGAGGLSLPYSGSVSSSSAAAFEVENTANRWAGLFRINNTGATYPALVGSNNGDGVGVYGNHTMGGTGVYGYSGSGTGVVGGSSTSTAIRGQAGSSSGLVDQYSAGVWGDSYSGIGVIGTSSERPGVSGWSTNRYGVQALGQGTNGWNSSALAAFAISSNDRAGYFSGDVHINGTLSKAGGSFKIDHPLDPETMYLSHSFVESPDMMNVYNGNVTTGADGRAVITLPDYFSALNRDFRYQLTVIGQFAQAIVEQEIADNEFTIRTDKPEVKVSWQITGIRQDAWANANRIPVEEPKEGDERGLYLHPEAFQKPHELSVERVWHPELTRLIESADPGPQLPDPPLSETE